MRGLGCQNRLTHAEWVNAWHGPGMAELRAVAESEGELGGVTESWIDEKRYQLICELGNAARVDAITMPELFRRLTATKRLEDARHTLPPQAATAEVDGIEEKADKLIWLAKAMLLVQDHPDWKDAKIARLVGKDKSTLSRSEEYQRVASLARGDTHSIPKGRVTIDPDSKTHDVEAVAKATGETFDKSDRGQPIPGSKYYQEYCTECEEPMRVIRDEVGKNPLCEDCTAS
jgi:hypothetical protein